MSLSFLDVVSVRNCAGAISNKNHSSKRISNIKSNLGIKFICTKEFMYGRRSQITLVFTNDVHIIQMYFLYVCYSMSYYVAYTLYHIVNVIKNFQTFNSFIFLSFKYILYFWFPRLLRIVYIESLNSYFFYFGF